MSILIQYETLYICSHYLRRKIIEKKFPLIFYMFFVNDILDILTQYNGPKLNAHAYLY